MAIKSKSRQKKFDTRIDFTPMVDMNMLLITFFMLCTTMIKSQTLQIALPTNEKVEKEEQNKVKQSEAVTIIIDGKIARRLRKSNRTRLRNLRLSPSSSTVRSMRRLASPSLKRACFTTMKASPRLPISLRAKAT